MLLLGFRRVTWTVALTGATGSHRAFAAAAAASRTAAAVNYYKRLQVPTDAAPDDIKAAYRRQALEWHPDVVEDSKRSQAEVQFRAISEAYEVLSDPVKRRAHDSQLGVTPKRSVSRTPAEGRGHAEATSRTSSASRQQDSASRGTASRAARGTSGSTPRPPSRRQTVYTSSSTTGPSPSTAAARGSSRRPFVRRDADRVFSEAFEGKTIDRILFEAKRRQREEAIAAARANLRTSSGAATTSSSSSSSFSSSAESTRGKEEATRNSSSNGGGDASGTRSDGTQAPAGREETLRRVVEQAAAQYAERAQREYGVGVLKHIRFGGLPAGPAPPPDSYMPFRPFVNTVVPDGVSVPPEPTLGPVSDVRDEKEVKVVPVATTNTPLEYPAPVDTLEDGTPRSRNATLSAAERTIHGAAYNMGQLYSYHRPY